MTQKTKDMTDLLNAIPETLKVIHDEVSEVGKTIVMSQLKSQDLVTRDEFDAQKSVLTDIATKLAKIEQRLAENS